MINGDFIVSPNPSLQPHWQPNANDDHQFVIFRLDHKKYALPLLNIRRVLRMVAVTAIPDPPANVEGVINIAGITYPVVDLRQILEIKSRKPGINDRLLVFETPTHKAALIVDEVLEVAAFSPQQYQTPDLLLGKSKWIKATVERTREVILVLDVGLLL